MIKFQVGDKVKAFGSEGIVQEINQESDIVICTFKGYEYIVCFFGDGTYVPWAKEPSLVLVSRPRKKVQRTIYLNIYDDYVFGSNTFADAKQHVNRQVNSLTSEPLEVTIEYEEKENE